MATAGHLFQKPGTDHRQALTIAFAGRLFWMVGQIIWLSGEAETLGPEAIQHLATGCDRCVLVGKFGFIIFIPLGNLDIICLSTPLTLGVTCT